MRGFERMTLANMRQNGVRSVVASCANCGRSADVNADLLPETLTVPRPGNASDAAAAAARPSRPDPLGTRGANPTAFLTFGPNARRCPRLRRPPPARLLQTGTGTAQTAAISTAAITAVIFSLVDRSMASSGSDANLIAALYAAWVFTL